MPSNNDNTSELYIGLMSGTSIDGVDVALVDFSNNQCKLVNFYLHPIPNQVRTSLSQLCNPKTIGSLVDENRIERQAELDNLMGGLFADAVNDALKHWSIDKSNIAAIGSHGQTIRHRAEYQTPFTIQIGDPNVIAERTGITTIADFRRADMAAGGQGAPLAPAFHNAVLRSDQENRVVLNLGGIANITLLQQDSQQPVIGFDTGPANTLMDAWFCQYHPDSPIHFDKDSQFAKQGELQTTLLQAMLADKYFKLPPPKSTGREMFSLEWLNTHIQQLEIKCSPADIQQTLLHLTVETICSAILELKLSNATLLCCGGGMHNEHLLDRLAKKLNWDVRQTNAEGIDGDYLEAMTFAWLARQRVLELPGNLPSVTGAKTFKVLGAEYIS